MYIEELEDGEVVNKEEQFCDDLYEGSMVVSDTKRALVGAGARALFYPTLLYNVVRNKIQAEFRWWDRVDEDHGINHLVIPTRDYLFAPSVSDINRAVEFLHSNASIGKTTYVHCKAGRGRSTTIVLCYLVKYKHMTPEAAYDYVRSIRPRVLLASSQWQAVQEYYLRVTRTDTDIYRGDGSFKGLDFPSEKEVAAFDDGTVVLISDSDLDGYDENFEYGLAGNKVLEELNLACRVHIASQAVIDRLSCLWLHCHSSSKMSTQKLGGYVKSNQLESIAVDMHVY